jgi:hypothetical protein
MIKSVTRWIFIVLLTLLSPFIYIAAMKYAHSYAAHPIITAISATSPLQAIIITLFNCIAAALTAAVTALPCGYLARKHVKIITIFLIALIESFPVYAFLHGPKHSNLLTTVLLGQLAAVVISTFVFVKLGSHFAINNRNASIT